VIQPVWRGYLREAIGNGVTRFLGEHLDYNVSVKVWEYPQEDKEMCMRYIREAVSEGAQAIALCPTDCQEIRNLVAQLADQKIPVITFNSDIPGSARLCYVGEDARRAGRIAGEIAFKFLRPDDHPLLIYAGSSYVGHKARIDGFMERLSELGFPMENCNVAATHNDYEETYVAVRAALQEDPFLSYIYMANRSVPACVKAIEDAGRAGRVRILSHDCSPEISRFLQEGKVDFTIDQDFSYQTHQSLTLLLRCLSEHKLPEQDAYCPPSPILTAELA